MLLLQKSKESFMPVIHTQVPCAGANAVSQAQEDLGPMAAWQAQTHLAVALEEASFAPEPPQGQPIPIGQGLYLNPSPLLGTSCLGANPF